MALSSLVDALFQPGVGGVLFVKGNGLGYCVCSLDLAEDAELRMRGMLLKDLLCS